MKPHSLPLETLAAYTSLSEMQFENYNERVKRDANGYCLTIILTNLDTGEMWPWTEGPFEDKPAAQRAAKRRRNRMKKPDAAHLHARVFVRPLWKSIDG